jgi:hypothetical protein
MAMPWTDTRPTRLRGDLLNFRHKKTDSKVGFSIYFYKEEDGTSGRTLIGPTLGRHACVAIC